jgi:hypothetical protein
MGEAMSDFDTRTYSAIERDLARAEGNIQGYVECTADARALVREYAVQARENPMTLEAALAGIEVSLLRGLHVGKAKP